MKTLLAGCAGLLFGVGLVVGGMADPARVHAFLDLAGAWDPTLLFVMAGAVGTAGAGYAWARRRGRSWLGATLPPPPSRTVDLRLVGGSLLFGIGWGLSGICPGPAFVLLGSGAARALPFVLGMWAAWLVYDRLLPRAGAADAVASRDASPGSDHR